MINVNNRKCIRNISYKRLKVNKTQNLFLIIAISVTTILLTALFSTGISIINSIQDSTMYQVGTSAHGGFKFLTQEQYDKVAKDTELKDISYNILVGFAENNELAEDYTEIRYSEQKCAEWNFCNPETGRLPEKNNEIAVPTSVLDDYGLPHKLGEELKLDISTGKESISGTFIVCGFWEKRAPTMANEILVSKSYQEKIAPTWINKGDYEKNTEINCMSGSINPELWFSSSINIDRQMDDLKSRCGFGSDVNDGVNWAYAISSIDFTSILYILFILIIILMAGYLIIYNIFYISVSGDIHFYGLLKTIGTTNRQLKRIVHIQALVFSAIGIPIGMILGYLFSFIIIPIISNTFSGIPFSIHLNPLIFILSGLFSFITVWISCIKPCKFVKRITPVEAVKYTENQNTKKRKKKSRFVSQINMAWENVKRTPKQTAAVILSMAICILLINTTVSLVMGFDEDKYIQNYVVTDFRIADRTVDNSISLDVKIEGITENDINYLKSAPGVTDFAEIYMSEGRQTFSGENLKRVKTIFKERKDDFFNEEQLKYYHDMLYSDNRIDSHIYGINEFAGKLMELTQGKFDWEEFKTGKYAIVSSYDDSGKYCYFNVGESIAVNLPNGKIKEYKIMAVGDIPYALGPQHSHGMDIYITLPESEYLANKDDCQGAMKVGFNVDNKYIDDAEEYVSNYCETGHTELSYKSRKTYSDSFKDMISTYVIVGGALAFILALIAILNFLNLTITSVKSRENQLAILQAVGMTGKQLKKMIIWEGLFKLILTSVFSLTAGQLIGYLILKLMTKEMWMFSYNYVVWPVISGIAVFALFAYYIPLIAYKKLCSRSLTDRMKI